MQVTIEEVNAVKKTLHIEIPEQEVARELESAYAKLKKTARVKGFRPGKVPTSVLKRMFKKDVHADVTSKLIQESFVDAIKQTDLKIVGSPQVDPPELNENAPYAYDATVEVNPEIADIDYKGLKLKRSNYAVSDDEIDAQLKMIQKRLATKETVAESRPVQEGDFVVIDYEGLKDGKPFAETQKTENFTQKIGEGAISKDLDKELIGLQPGETKEVRVVFPEDYFNQHLANQTIDFFVTLKEIREEKLPALDDTLAKKVGSYENLDDLKNKIRENLEKGYNKRIEQELNEQIFQSLFEKVQFEVPEAMVEYELEGILNEAERSFAYQNINMEDMGITREGLADRYRETALKQVRRHLILNKVVEQEKLEVSDDELETGFHEMAEALGQPAEDVRKYYRQNNDKLDMFKHTLLEKKGIKLIIDSSEIETVEPEKASEDDENSN
jgi:trigger factor